MPPPTHERIPWSLVVLAGSLTALAPLSIDMYLASLPSIQKSFGATHETTQATLGAFLIGLAIGQFVYGPLSDRIGRRGPLLAGIVIYVIASAACAAAPNIELMIVARFAQALGGCSGQVIARASIRDRYDHQTSARALSSLMLVMGVAPMLAPLAGSLLLGLGWRWIFVAQAVIGVIIGVWALVGFSETHSKENAAISRAEPVWVSFGKLIVNPRLIGYTLAGAFNGGALFAYIAAASVLLIEVYHQSPTVFSLVFMLNAAGMIGMSQVNAHLLRYFTPEVILTRSRLSSIAFAALLMIDAATGFGGLWGVLIPLFLTIASFGLVGPNTQAASLNVDLARTGAISSLMGAATFGVGAIMSVVTGLFYDGTARPLAAIILVAILLSSAALYGLARPYAARTGD